jgi:hypothetical protein
MLDMERHRFIPAAGDLQEFGDSLHIDTTAVSPEAAARQVVAAFGLPAPPDR